jgi:hypothetical protein
MPIALTDAQLTAVMTAAAPLHPRFRGEFLQEVANELARLPEVGDGNLHRILGQVQRKHHEPPRESGNHTAPRHLGSKRRPSHVIVDDHD